MKRKVLFLPRTKRQKFIDSTMAVLGLAIAEFFFEEKDVIASSLITVGVMVVAVLAGRLVYFIIREIFRREE